MAAAGANRLGRPLPLLTIQTALGDPFVRFTTKGPYRDLPDEPGWWISQMGAYLEQRAASTPVLVCLDDLQWASPVTLTALWTLSLELKHEAVARLLARTSTSQHRTRNLFRTLEKGGATRVNLAPFDNDSVAAMVTSAFGAPPCEALLALARGAAGNPALLTELIRGLSDNGAVRVRGEQAVLVSW